MTNLPHYWKNAARVRVSHDLVLALANYALDVDRPWPKIIGKYSDCEFATVYYDKGWFWARITGPSLALVPEGGLIPEITIEWEMKDSIPSAVIVPVVNTSM